MVTTRRLICLATLLLVGLLGLAVQTAEAQQADLAAPELTYYLLGTCTANCGPTGSVTCEGSSCGAEDDVGCTYLDDQGEWQEKSCQPSLAPAATTQSIKQSLIDKILLIHELREEMEGKELELPTTISLFNSLAICTADCGNGQSVSCTATGDDSCFAVDGAGCQTFHSGGDSTFEDCDDVLAGPQ